MTELKYDIFLSYSVSDSKEVETLASILSDKGLRVWFDKWTLVPGASWLDEIQAAISNSNCIGFCIGASSRSKWIDTELQRGMEKKIKDTQFRIIPILLPGAKLNNIPEYLRNYQLIDFRKGFENEKEINRLIATIIQSENVGGYSAEVQIGDRLLQLEDPSGALSHYKKALKIAKANYGDIHPAVAITMNKIAGVLQEFSDTEKAIEYYNKALDIDLAVFGDRHPNVALRYNNLGSAWSDLGDAKKAIEYYNKALEIDLAVYGGKHTNVALRYNNLGSAWSDLGDAKKAIEYYNKALEIFTAVYGSDHTSTRTVQANLDALKG